MGPFVRVEWIYLSMRRYAVPYYLEASIGSPEVFILTEVSCGQVFRGAFQLHTWVKRAGI